MRRRAPSPDEDDGVVAVVWDATGAVPAFSQREAVCLSWWEEREMAEVSCAGFLEERKTMNDFVVRSVL